MAGDVEGNAGLAVQAQFLVVLNLSLGSVVNNEVRLKVFQFLGGGLDEHVGNKVCLPGHFHDEANGHAGILVSAAESVNNEQALVAQFLLGDILNGSPGALAHGVVVVLVLVRSPPNGVLGVFVHDDVLILGGTASVNTSHNVDSTQLADLTLFVAYQFGLGLFLEQQLVGRIVHDLSRAGDAILGKIQICHVTNTSFLKNGHVYSALSSHRISQKAIEIYDCVFSYLTLYIKIRQNQQTWT